MSRPASPGPVDPAWFCELAGLGVLDASGPDARDFLHGQLSSDVKALDPGEGQYTSYNSPKGRMLMNGFLWRFPAPTADRHGILLSADLAEAVSKRLGAFVLRSKVVLADMTGAFVRFGVAGPQASELVHSALGFAPNPHATHIRASDGTIAVGLPDGRFVVLVPTEAASAVRIAFATQVREADEAAWRRASIRSGVPLITAATSDQLIAQTANWEILGGISFGKGCYPGQEIVARMQYLGRIKDRLHAFRTDAAEPVAGARVFHSASGDQPIGTVVNAAPAPGGGTELLAVVAIAALSGDALRLGKIDGPALVPMPLPYAIPEPAAPRGRIA